MTNYKFHIQKGTEAGEGGTLHICPHCGRRSFTYYVSRGGRTVNDPTRGIYYGICYHRNSCGYINYPNGVADPDTTDGSSQAITEAPAQPQQPPQYYPVSLLKQTLKPFGSNLLKYLQKLKLPNLAEKAHQYFIGATRDGGTIFWQIDLHDKIHRGKIMFYGSDGHRIKDAKGNGKVSSVRVRIGRPITTEPNICYFGAHLLTRFPNADVGVVESEKTALICSCIFPQQVWLATGTKNNLHSQYSECLKGRNVIVYPDYDAFEEWSEKMRFIAEAYKIKYKIDDSILQFGSGKEDLADLLLKNL